MTLISFFAIHWRLLTINFEAESRETRQVKNARMENSSVFRHPKLTLGSIRSDTFTEISAIKFPNQSKNVSSSNRSGELAMFSILVFICSILTAIAMRISTDANDETIPVQLNQSFNRGDVDGRVETLPRIVIVKPDSIVNLPYHSADPARSKNVNSIQVCRLDRITRIPMGMRRSVDTV